MPEIQNNQFNQQVQLSVSGPSMAQAGKVEQAVSSPVNNFKSSNPTSVNQLTRVVSGNPQRPAQVSPQTMQNVREEAKSSIWNKLGKGLLGAAAISGVVGLFFPPALGVAAFLALGGILLSTLPSKPKSNEVAFAKPPEAGRPPDVEMEKLKKEQEAIPKFTPQKLSQVPVNQIHPNVVQSTPKNIPEQIPSVATAKTQAKESVTKKAIDSTKEKLGKPSTDNKLIGAAKSKLDKAKEMLKDKQAITELLHHKTLLLTYSKKIQQKWKTETKVEPKKNLTSQLKAINVKLHEVNEAIEKRLKEFTEKWR